MKKKQRSAFVDAPLALESVLSPAQGFSVWTTKGRESLPLHLTHYVTPSKNLHSHQRSNSNINQREQHGVALGQKHQADVCPFMMSTGALSEALKG